MFLEEFLCHYFADLLQGDRFAGKLSIMYNKVFTFRWPAICSPFT